MDLVPSPRVHQQKPPTIQKIAHSKSRAAVDMRKFFISFRRLTEIPLLSNL